MPVAREVRHEKVRRASMVRSKWWWSTVFGVTLAVVSAGCVTEGGGGGDDDDEGVRMGAGGMGGAVLAPGDSEMPPLVVLHPASAAAELLDDVAG